MFACGLIQQPHSHRGPLYTRGLGPWEAKGLSFPTMRLILVAESMSLKVRAEVIKYYCRSSKHTIFNEVFHPQISFQVCVLGIYGKLGMWGAASCKRFVRISLAPEIRASQKIGTFTHLSISVSTVTSYFCYKWHRWLKSSAIRRFYLLRCSALVWSCVAASSSRCKSFFFVKTRRNNGHKNNSSGKIIKKKRNSAGPRYYGP